MAELSLKDRVLKHNAPGREKPWNARLGHSSSRLILPPQAGRSTAENMEIIRIVEQSPLPVARVREQLNLRHCSRYILTWKLMPTLAVGDVLVSLELALKALGLKHARVRHRPRLLSDNGPAQLSKSLREYLAAQGIEHTRGSPSAR